MKTTRFVCRSALAAGITGAFFVSLMAGSASASCGYAMTKGSLQQHSAAKPAPSDWEERTKHPLRGEFPYAAAIPLSEQMAESEREKAKKHPLRGDFPYAATNPQAR